jgi:hypothetical protein
MIEQRLKAAALQANLSKQERDNVDALAKLLDTHQQISNLPAPQAAQKYGSLTPEQQQSLSNFTATDPVEPKRNWFQKGLHFIGQGLELLNKPSNAVMQYNRTIQMAKNDPAFANKSFSEIWAAAGKTGGEGYFDPGRIKDAEQKYTPARVALAQKVRQGQTLDYLIANGTGTCCTSCSRQR